MIRANHLLLRPNDPGFVDAPKRLKSLVPILTQSKSFPGRILPRLKLIGFPRTNSGVLRMLNTIRLAVGLTAILLGEATLAQNPNYDYFPLKPKSKWTYKVPDQLVESRL